jgi:glycerophosphoryl diester phosphodiesterase
MGADGIELDLHATADGQLVVVHDGSLAGRPLSTLTLEQVRTHRLSNGEWIPTLAEALDAIGSETEAFLEVKTLPPALDATFLGTLAHTTARCRVHSFDHRIVRRLREQRPALAGGVLSASYPVHPVAQLTDARAVDLWQEQSLVDRELVAAVHAAGGRVQAWTVDDPARMRVLRDLGVDGICTNRPDVGVATLR